MVAAADEDRRKSEFAKLEHTKYIFPYCLFSPWSLYLQQILQEKIEAINPFHGFFVTSVLSFPLFSQSLQFPYPANHQEIPQYRQSCNTPSNQSTAGSSLSAMSEDDEIHETQVDYIH